MSRARADLIARNGVREVPDARAALEDIAADEAAHHGEWARGLTPSQYLLALVDRAQARKNIAKEQTHG
ncbi:hypothetical protein KGD82_13385 [Nocardiopsis eucommiae]|uniref:Uncharacterized protein n=1 Tax=Nocardiopsis eucommiae TaxID=2831970 RepID=A0A975QM37_9ACTN|nr:hypothetical protein KGD82_13385 [Nocardiopsis eucommiae]